MIRVFCCVCCLLLFVVDNTGILHALSYRIIQADMLYTSYMCTNVQVTLATVGLLLLLYEQVRVGINQMRAILDGSTRT